MATEPPREIQSSTQIISLIADDAKGADKRARAVRLTYEGAGVTQKVVKRELYVTKAEARQLVGQLEDRTVDWREAAPHYLLIQMLTRVKRRTRMGHGELSKGDDATQLRIRDLCVCTAPLYEFINDPRFELVDHPAHAKWNKFLANVDQARRNNQQTGNIAIDRLIGLPASDLVEVKLKIAFLRYRFIQFAENIKQTLPDPKLNTPPLPPELEALRVYYVDSLTEFAAQLNAMEARDPRLDQHQLRRLLLNQDEAELGFPITSLGTFLRNQADQIAAFSIRHCDTYNPRFKQLFEHSASPLRRELVKAKSALAKQLTTHAVRFFNTESRIPVVQLDAISGTSAAAAGSVARDSAIVQPATPSSLRLPETPNLVRRTSSIDLGSIADAAAAQPEIHQLHPAAEEKKDVVLSPSAAAAPAASKEELAPNQKFWLDINPYISKGERVAELDEILAVYENLDKVEKLRLEKPKSTFRKWLNGAEGSLKRIAAILGSPLLLVGGIAVFVLAMAADLTIFVLRAAIFIAVGLPLVLLALAVDLVVQLVVNPLLWLFAGNDTTTDRSVLKWLADNSSWFRFDSQFSLVRSLKQKFLDGYKGYEVEVREERETVVRESVSEMPHEESDVSRGRFDSITERPSIMMGRASMALPASSSLLSPAPVISKDQHQQVISKAKKNQCTGFFSTISATIFSISFVANFCHEKIKQLVFGLKESWRVAKLWFEVKFQPEQRKDRVEHIFRHIALQNKEKHEAMLEGLQEAFALMAAEARAKMSVADEKAAEAKASEPPLAIALSLTPAAPPEEKAKAEEVHYSSLTLPALEPWHHKSYATPADFISEIFLTLTHKLVDPTLEENPGVAMPVIALSGGSLIALQGIGLSSNQFVQILQAVPEWFAKSLMGKELGPNGSLVAAVLSSFVQYKAIYFGLEGLNSLAHGELGALQVFLESPEQITLGAVTLVALGYGVGLIPKLPTDISVNLGGNDVFTKAMEQYASAIANTGAALVNWVGTEAHEAADNAQLGLNTIELSFIGLKSLMVLHMLFSGGHKPPIEGIDADKFVKIVKEKYRGLFYSDNKVSPAEKRELVIELFRELHVSQDILVEPVHAGKDTIQLFLDSITEINKQDKAIKTATSNICGALFVAPKAPGAVVAIAPTPAQVPAAAPGLGLEPAAAAAPVAPAPPADPREVRLNALKEELRYKMAILRDMEMFGGRPTAHAEEQYEGFKSPDDAERVYDDVVVAYKEYNQLAKELGQPIIDESRFLKNWYNKHVHPGSSGLAEIISILVLPLTILWRLFKYYGIGTPAVRESIRKSNSKDLAMFMQFLTDWVAPVERTALKTLLYLLRMVLAGAIILYPLSILLGFGVTNFMLIPFAVVAGVVVISLTAVGIQRLRTGQWDTKQINSAIGFVLSPIFLLVAIAASVVLACLALVGAIFLIPMAIYNYNTGKGYSYGDYFGRAGKALTLIWDNLLGNRFVQGSMGFLSTWVGGKSEAGSGALHRLSPMKRSTMKLSYGQFQRLLFVGRLVLFASLIAFPLVTVLGINLGLLPLVGLKVSLLLEILFASAIAFTAFFFIVSTANAGKGKRLSEAGKFILGLIVGPIAFVVITVISVLLLGLAVVLFLPAMAILFLINKFSDKKIPYSSYSTAVGYVLGVMWDDVNKVSWDPMGLLFKLGIQRGTKDLLKEKEQLDGTKKQVDDTVERVGSEIDLPTLGQEYHGKFNSIAAWYERLASAADTNSERLNVDMAQVMRQLGPVSVVIPSEAKVAATTIVPSVPLVVADVPVALAREGKRGPLKSASPPMDEEHLASAALSTPISLGADKKDEKSANPDGDDTGAGLGLPGFPEVKLAVSPAGSPVAAKKQRNMGKLAKTMGAEDLAAALAAGPPPETKSSSAATPLASSQAALAQDNIPESTPPWQESAQRSGFNIYFSDPLFRGLLFLMLASGLYGASYLAVTGGFLSETIVIAPILTIIALVLIANVVVHWFKSNSVTAIPPCRAITGIPQALEALERYKAHGLPERVRAMFDKALLVKINDAWSLLDTHAKNPWSGALVNYPVGQPLVDRRAEDVEILKKAKQLIEAGELHNAKYAQDFDNLKEVFECIRDHAKIDPTFRPKVSNNAIRIAVSLAALFLAGCVTVLTLIFTGTIDIAVTNIAWSLSLATALGFLSWACARYAMDKSSAGPYKQWVAIFGVLGVTFLTLSVLSAYASSLTSNTALAAFATAGLPLSIFAPLGFVFMVTAIVARWRAVVYARNDSVARTKQRDSRLYRASSIALTVIKFLLVASLLLLSFVSFAALFDLTQLGALSGLMSFATDIIINMAGIGGLEAGSQWLGAFSMLTFGLSLFAAFELVRGMLTRQPSEAKQTYSEPLVNNASRGKKVWHQLKGIIKPTAALKLFFAVVPIVVVMIMAAKGAFLPGGLMVMLPIYLVAALVMPLFGGNVDTNSKGFNRFFGKWLGHKPTTHETKRSFSNIIGREILVLALLLPWLALAALPGVPTDLAYMVLGLGIAATMVFRWGHMWWKGNVDVEGQLHDYERTAEALWECMDATAFEVKPNARFPEVEIAMEIRYWPKSLTPILWGLTEVDNRFGHMDVVFHIIKRKTDNNNSWERSDEYFELSWNDGAPSYRLKAKEEPGQAIILKSTRLPIAAFAGDNGIDSFIRSSLTSFGTFNGKHYDTLGNNCAHVTAMAVRKFFEQAAQHERGEMAGQITHMSDLIAERGLRPQKAFVEMAKSLLEMKEIERQKLMAKAELTDPDRMELYQIELEIYELEIARARAELFGRDANGTNTKVLQLEGERAAKIPGFSGSKLATAQSVRFNVEPALPLGWRHPEWSGIAQREGWRDLDWRGKDGDKILGLLNARSKAAAVEADEAKFAAALQPTSSRSWSNWLFAHTGQIQFFSFALLLTALVAVATPLNKVLSPHIFSIVFVSASVVCLLGLMVFYAFPQLKVGTRQDIFDHILMIVCLFGVLALGLGLYVSADIFLSSPVMLSFLALTTVFVSYLFGRQQLFPNELENTWRIMTRPSQYPPELELDRILHVGIDQDPNNRENAEAEKKFLLNFVDTAITAIERLLADAQKGDKVVTWGGDPHPYFAGSALRADLARLKAFRQKIINNTVAPREPAVLKHTCKHLRTCQLSSDSNTASRKRAMALFAVVLVGGLIVAPWLLAFKLSTLIAIFTQSQIGVWLIGFVGITLLATKAFMEWARQHATSYDEYTGKTSRPSQRMTGERLVVWISNTLLTVLTITIGFLVGVTSAEFLAMALVTATWGVGQVMASKWVQDLVRGELIKAVQVQGPVDDKAERKADDVKVAIVPDNKAEVVAAAAEALLMSGQAGRRVSQAGGRVSYVEFHQQADDAKRATSRYFNLEDDTRWTSRADAAMRTYFVLATVLGTAEHTAYIHPIFNMVWSSVNGIGSFPGIKANKRNWDKASGREKALIRFEEGVAWFLIGSNIASATTQLLEEYGGSQFQNNEWIKHINPLASYGFALSMTASMVRAFNDFYFSWQACSPRFLLKEKLNQYHTMARAPGYEKDKLLQEALAIARCKRAEILEAHETEADLIAMFVEHSAPDPEARKAITADITAALQQPATPMEERYVKDLFETNAKKCNDNLLNFLGYLAATLCFWIVAVAPTVNSNIASETVLKAFGGGPNIFLAVGGILKAMQLLRMGWDWYHSVSPEKIDTTRQALLQHYFSNYPQLQDALTTTAKNGVFALLDIGHLNEFFNSHSIVEKDKIHYNIALLMRRQALYKDDVAPMQFLENLTKEQLKAACDEFMILMHDVGKQNPGDPWLAIAPALQALGKGDGTYRYKIDLLSAEQRGKAVVDIAAERKVAVNSILVNGVFGGNRAASESVVQPDDVKVAGPELPIARGSVAGDV